MKYGIYILLSEPWLDAFGWSIIVNGTNLLFEVKGKKSALSHFFKRLTLA